MDNNSSPSQFYKMIDDVWSLIREADVYTARADSQKLVRQVESQIKGEDTSLLPVLAQAYFVSGYAISMNSKNKEAQAAEVCFHQMEEIARIINDPAFITIALTYQGDTLRRAGHISRSLTYLQSAYNMSQGLDPAAHGNCAQLLGRLYFYMEDIGQFERLMQEAEQIADTLSTPESSVHGQYNLGTVYIDYARAYSKLAKMQKAMDYLDRAVIALPSTPHWQTLLTETRASLLIRSGDINEGLPLAIRAVELCYAHGNRRLLERLFELQRFLDQQSVQISNAASSLNEALYGPFDP
jgi:tetratricopeptide (TPR) repeat protein